MNHVIYIHINNITYPVYIGRNLEETLINSIIQTTYNRQIILITDKYFAACKAPLIIDQLSQHGFECELYQMTGGKGSKSFAELITIYGILETKNFSRDATLIALGGGVIGDLGGFAASTWYRGMNMVHMPTTLMAMVDSSIGGKVAINFRETINAIGNYYHPTLNVMDLGIIDTLSQRDYVSGIAEVIKCGLIADKEFFDWIEKNVHDICSRKEPILINCIRKAIEIKVAHVDGDVTETGKRLLLNFGHTLGHAIEMATQTELGETYRHGEGVALGMVAAMYIANEILGTDKVETSRIISLLRQFGLPVNISAQSIGFDRQKLINLCFQLSFKDKKRKNNSLRFVLLNNIGAAKIYSNIPEHIVLGALNSLITE